MLRNLSIAVALVAIGAGVWFVMSGSSDVHLDGPGRSTSQVETPTATDDIDIADTYGDAPQPDRAEEGLPSTEEARIDLEQGPSGLTGTVRDDQGSVRAGARVTLYHTDLAELEEEGGSTVFELMERDFGSVGTLRAELRERVKPLARVTTDGDGRFAFEGVPNGQYVVSGVADGYLASPSSRLAFVTDGEGVADVALLSSGRLAGRVVDPSYNGVAGAEVHVTGELMDPADFRRGGSYFTFEEVLVLLLNDHVQSGRTDGNGAFAFVRLPMLEYDIQVKATPWAATEVREHSSTPRELEIVLDVGATITGVVLDPDGVPVPEAELRVSRDDGMGPGDWMRSLRSREQLKSDADGTFRIEGLAAGEYRVQAGKAGYQTTTQQGIRLERGGEQSVEITVPIGGVLAGIVVDDAGQPVAGAEVAARAEGNDRQRAVRRGGPPGFGGDDGTRTETDVDGRFRLDRLAPGSYRLDVTADGFVDGRESAATDRDDLRIAMSPGVDLTGRVVDPSGAPIAGAQVSRRERNGGGRRGMPFFGGGGARRSATTDAEGRFRLSGLEAGSVDLQVRAKGFLDGSFEVETGEVGDLSLAYAPRVSGIVLGPDGRAVPGARVRAQVQWDGAAFMRGGRGGGGNRGGGRGFGRAANATTRGDGTFELYLDDIESEYTLTASAKGLIDGTVEGITVETGDVEGIEIRLAPAAVIYGRVTSREGFAVTGAEVSVVAMDPDDGASPRGRGGRGGPGGGRRGFMNRSVGRSDVDGAYEVDGLAAGTYEVRIRAKGHAGYGYEGIALVEGGRVVHDAVLEPERRLEGRVVDATGAPISSARVMVTGPQSGFQRGNTGDDGTFSIGGLSADELRVTASAAGYSDQSIDAVVAGTGALGSALEAAYIVSGQVIDGSTREPLDGARIRLTSLAETQSDPAPDFGRGGRGGRRGGGRTDEEGRFTIDGIRGGDYQLEISAEGFQTLTVEPYRVGPQNRTEDIEWAVQPGARVVGTIVDDSGKPVADARLRATPSGAETQDPAPAGRRRGGPRGQSSRTDDDGSFILGGLEVGPNDIRITHDEYITRTITGHEVEEPGLRGEVPVRWVLERGAEVRGVVLDSTGRRLAGGRLRFRGGLNEETKMATITEEGTYSVGGLEAGTYTVSYSERGSREPLFESTIELRNRQELTYDVR
ncbi:MAG: carboxypeptidase regulatory-like domain-containing protein, partial [Planctomycetes bacterium]|nr:carboxypeptidase regulatory-like domain-containing protein [Planctomycetota bacterium]